MIAPPCHAVLADAVRRGFQHTAMKELCAQVATGNVSGLSPAVRQVFIGPIEPELAEVAQAFVDLQTTRHQADYAPHQPLAAARVSALMQQAIDAFASWQVIRGADNANAFCVALLLHRTWRVD